MNIDINIIHPRFILLYTAAVAKWLSVRLACRRSGFDSRAEKTEIFKTGSDSSIAERPAIGVMSRVLRDDHYEGLARVTACVAR